MIRYSSEILLRSGLRAATLQGLGVDPGSTIGQLGIAAGLVAALNPVGSPDVAVADGCGRDPRVSGMCVARI